MFFIFLFLAAGVRVHAQDIKPAPQVDPATGIVHSQRLRSGMPLGGIGVGGYQSMTDGTFALAAGTDSPACFGAVWARAQGRSSAAVTALRNAYSLPCLPAVDYDGLYPQAKMRFPGAALPVDLSLATFSPVIPFDLKNSSLPAAAVVFHLHNPSPVPIDVAVALSWSEARSETGQVAANPAENGFFSLRLSHPTAVVTRPSLFDAFDVPSEVTLMAYPPRRDATVSRAAWNPAETRPGWWDSFASEGQVPDFAGGTTPPGTQSAAVVVVRLTLKPGATVDVPFAVAWTNQHRYALSGEDLGHYYQVGFADSNAVARYLLDNWSALYALTEEWQKRLLYSNMPLWISRRIINSAAALNSALHTRDGRFSWPDEPGSPASPLTAPRTEPLDRREARLGAFSLTLDLFPALAVQQLRQAGSRIALHTGTPPTEEAADYTLLLARYALQTNDPAVLRHEYTHLRRALAALLPSAPGDATEPDPPTAAAFSLRLTALKAGAALARLDRVQLFAEAAPNGLGGNIAAVLPQMDADVQLEHACERAATDGASRFVAQRWNGRYFADGPDRACATDQLFGVWMANTLGIEPPLSAQNIATALTTLRATNDSLSSATWGPVWRTNAEGQALSDEAADCLMPATLLSEAILAIQQNQPDAGVALLQRMETIRYTTSGEVWNTPLRLRSENTPVNADSTATAQATDWNMLGALEGFGYDSTVERMTLSPKIPGTWRSFSAPVHSPIFWGHVEFKPLAHGALLTFRLDRFIAPPALRPDRTSGLTRLSLRSLRVPGLPSGATAPPVVHASLGPNPLGVRTVADSSGDMIVLFATPLSLSAGDRLEVDIH
jgi:uncharacterized protein (DUF608 family)